MFLDGSINVVLTAAKVSYIFKNADYPDAYGVAEISGKASLFHYTDAEPSAEKFNISLEIHGRSASQMRQAYEKESRRPFPMNDPINEITDDVIGILVKVTTKTGRYTMLQGSLFLNPAQFDKLVGNLATGMEMMFYFRQSIQSQSYLIGTVEFCSMNIEPQL